jgi:hypothetical protein
VFAATVVLAAATAAVGAGDVPGVAAAAGNGAVAGFPGAGDAAAGVAGLLGAGDLAEGTAVALLVSALMSGSKVPLITATSDVAQDEFSSGVSKHAGAI